MHKAIFSTILLSAAFVFCKNEKKEPFTEADFYVRYLADEQKTVAQASFKKGETAESMTSQLANDLDFQGSAMRERVLDGLVRYQTDKSGGMDRVFEFKWKNAAGERQKHEAQIAPIHDFELSEPFRKAENALLSWSGAGPLQKDEALKILFEDEKNGETVDFSFVGPTDLAAVPIPTARVKNGKWRVSLVKTRLFERTENREKLHSVTEFYAKAKVFDVK